MFRKLISSRALPWLGAAAGVALLAWVLRALDVSRFLDVLKSAGWWLLVVLPVTNLVQALLRAEKWRHMLHPLAEVKRFRLFGAIMGGYFADMVVPVRIGPLVRAWLIARLENMRTGSLLATVALDRIIDGFVFFGFAALALAWWRFPEQESAVRDGILTGAGVSAAALIAAVIVLIAVRRGAVHRLAAAFPVLTFPVLPAHWRSAIGRFTLAFTEGVVWPKEAWRGATVIGVSVLIKLIAVSYYVSAGLAFGVALQPADYLFLMVFLGFLLFVAGMLKIVGGFTAGTIFALELLGVEVETALAMVLIVQGTTIVTVASCGAAALWRQGLSMSMLRGARREQFTELRAAGTE